MIFFASSHWVEQYFLPCSAMQLQPSFAHFLSDVDMARSSWNLLHASDAVHAEEDVRLPATCQQMFGVFQAGLSQLGTTKHSGNLLCALRIFHAANVGLGAPALFGFFDQEVLVAKRCNLWKMRDAEHLLALRQRLEFPSNRL